VIVTLEFEEKNGADRPAPAARLIGVSDQLAQFGVERLPDLLFATPR
jgi:hypothetical protein